VTYLKFLLVTLLVSTSCQSDPFRRPIEPQCISNGDGTAECTEGERSYHEPNTVNFTCTPPDSAGRYQKYVLELEERLLKCEANN
jgi:hypothetical protein